MVLFIDRELITHNTENLGAVLKHVIYNELSQQRNPSNMAVLGVIFMTEPDQAAKVSVVSSCCVWIKNKF